jgi:hypothetical protein
MASTAALTSKRTVVSHGSLNNNEITQRPITITILSVTSQLITGHWPQQHQMRTVLHAYSIRRYQFFFFWGIGTNFSFWGGHSTNFFNFRFGFGAFEIETYAFSVKKEKL